MLKIVAFALGLALAALASHQSTNPPVGLSDPTPCSPSHPCPK